MIGYRSDCAFHDHKCEKFAEIRIKERHSSCIEGLKTFVWTERGMAFQYSVNGNAVNGNGHAPNRRLRIAQVAPLYESVPPKLYGGTERVVAYLTEELARRGHQVTLFASGDSTAKAPLEGGTAAALRLTGLDFVGPALHLPMISRVMERAADFDIIHSHLDYWIFPYARLIGVPIVSTMHGRLDLDVLASVYQFYSDVPLVSISDAQRKPLPDANWVGTVYHGLPPDLLEYRAEPGRYLAFLGRICPEKRPDIAIEVAVRSGLPLKIAAKVDRVDREYFAEKIQPLLSHPNVEFIGEVDERQKSDFLAHALGLIFPIDWPEPFGLTMIEALACGTPVLARPCGSVPEIIRNGVTGFVAERVDDLVRAVHRLPELSRSACREEFERRFVASEMAKNYERIYDQLIRSRQASAAMGGGGRMLTREIDPS